MQTNLMKVHFENIIIVLSKLIICFENMILFFLKIIFAKKFNDMLPKYKCFVWKYSFPGKSMYLLRKYDFLIRKSELLENILFFASDI